MIYFLVPRRSSRTWVINRHSAPPPADCFCIQTPAFSGGKVLNWLREVVRTDVRSGRFSGRFGMGGRRFRSGDGGLSIARERGWGALARGRGEGESLLVDAIG